eukprot:scaffold653535_cov90-Prasinocladus_malaysianus.AAC.1
MHLQASALRLNSARCQTQSPNTLNRGEMRRLLKSRKLIAKSCNVVGSAAAPNKCPHPWHYTPQTLRKCLQLDCIAFVVTVSCLGQLIPSSFLLSHGKQYFNGN